MMFYVACTLEKRDKSSLVIKTAIAEVAANTKEEASKLAASDFMHEYPEFSVVGDPVVLKAGDGK
jgi:hypothetical protein